MFVCVPLRAAQLFVRCGSLDELADALGHAMQKAPFDGLALHEGEWATLLSTSIDPALARLLSERFGTALALTLDGGALALSVTTYESGVAGAEERDPAPPHFRDVEQVAWELLQYLGVPAALRLLDLAKLELADHGLPALVAQNGELFDAAAVPPPRAEGPQPPAEPDVLVESQAGEARALEVRQLPGGIPTDAWAQALADVEQAQAHRLLRALAFSDEPRVPRPTFAYRTLQPLRTEKLLAKARRERPWLARLLDPEREPPLSLAGFTQLCRTKLANVARAHGPWLEVRAGDALLRAPVREVYEVYLTTLDEAATASELGARVQALLQQGPPPVDPAQVLPTLRGFVHDDGVWIQPAPEGDMQQALANLDARTEAAPEGIRWFDLEHGRVVSCEFPDAACSGRVLSPHARGLILSVLGAEAAIAAAPTRDALLAVSADDDDGLAWLRDEAARRFAEGPFPLDPGLWVLRADSARRVAGGRGQASGDGEDHA